MASHCYIVATLADRQYPGSYFPVHGRQLGEAVRSGEGGGAGDHQAIGAEGRGEIGQCFQRWPAVDHLLPFQ
jgi:hypothetical protein